MTALNKRQLTADHLNISGKDLGELIKLVTDGKVSRGNGRKILEALFEGETDPAAYAEKKGLIISNDTGAMEAVIKAVVAADTKAVEDFKSGKEKALMALFGKCMKELRGNCDPQTLREALIAEINK